MYITYIFRFVIFPESQCFYVDVALYYYKHLKGNLF
jgi:hypothetical protein